MGQPNSSNDDTKEMILKVLSVTWTVVWTLIKWSFIITIWTFTMFLACAGLAKFPEIPRDDRRKKRDDINQFSQQFPNLKLSEILQEFEDTLAQLEQQGKLTPQQEKVVRKLRSFDRSKYDKRLKDLFPDENELEVLLLLILKLLGVEVY
ncbi:MAG TPA: hypothetical protein V6D13_10890 [Halomicronema sp.]